MSDTEPDPGQLTVDVPALTAMLDGHYGEIRQMVRKELSQHASVLDEAIELPRDEFRERVLELVREMAAMGSTGLGFPTKYGGGGDIGASVAAFETLGFGEPRDHCAFAGKGNTGGDQCIAQIVGVICQLGEGAELSRGIAWLHARSPAHDHVGEGVGVSGYYCGGGHVLIT